MRTWNNPAVNFVHASCVAINVAAGILNVKHGHARISLINWFGVGVIVGINIGMGLLQRMRDRIHAQIQRELRAQMVDTVSSAVEQQQAMEMALANLKVVAKATGAKISKAGDEARITIGETVFHISYRHICKEGIVSTCLNMGASAGVPLPEQIASTLLLLKNDPSIFDRWRRQDHYYA